MTNGAREEIEKVASKTAQELYVQEPCCAARCNREEQFKVIVLKALLTQVEKARREQIEEDAICAEDTKFIETCSERIVALVQLRHRIAKAIRNKLEKE